LPDEDGVTPVDVIRKDGNDAFADELLKLRTQRQ
jgi:hypothetical protein